MTTLSTQEEKQEKRRLANEEAAKSQVAQVFGFTYPGRPDSKAHAQLVQEPEEALSVKDCFPYPESAGDCPICNLPWKGHDYTDFLLDEKHQQRIRDWFDHKQRVIGQVEALIFRADRSPSPSALQERDRVFAIRDMLKEAGPVWAMTLQHVMDYDTGARRSLMQIFDVKRRLHQVKVHSDKEARLARLRLSQVEDRYPKDPLKKFKAMWGLVAADSYKKIREECETIESLVETERMKFETIGKGPSLSESLGALAAQLATKDQDKLRAQGPAPALENRGAQR